MSHGVVAIDVDVEPPESLSFVAGTAKKFFPHITILPRIIFPQTWSEDKFSNAFSRLAQALIPPIELRGPIQISEELAWYECFPDCTGFRHLLDMHQVALSLVRQQQVLIFKSFLRENYRPHLTFFWNGKLSTVTLPSSLRVYPTAISLYRYAGDPKTGPVRRRAIARFKHT